MIVLAGSDYVDALREREIFSGRPSTIRTGLETYRALPPKATVRFPFQERDFDGGYEPERTSWQRAHHGVDIDGTEQASLKAFEDVDNRFLATRQIGFGTQQDG